MIHHYRESLLSTFSPLTSSSPWPDYKSLMARIYALLPAHPVPSAHASPATSPASQDETAAFPPSGSTTHVLHLAPHGEIQAHVDNVDASGSVIIGVSLGSARILRLREKSGTKGGAGEGAGWDVLLPNGSLYLQRCAWPFQPSSLFQEWHFALRCNARDGCEVAKADVAETRCGTSTSTRFCRTMIQTRTGAGGRCSVDID